MDTLRDKRLLEALGRRERTVEGLAVSRVLAGPADARDRRDRARRRLAGAAAARRGGRRRLPGARLGAAVGARSQRPDRTRVDGRAGRRPRSARCSSGCWASTRSTPCSTSRPRRSSAIANRNPVSTFETNIAGHLGAARGLPPEPARSSRSWSPRRTRPTATTAAALRRGHAARRAASLRRQQVVRRPDRPGLRRRPTAARSRSPAAATSTAAAT